MQKVWNWFADKKSQTVRKWRSTIFGGASRGETTNGGLKPIGGSDGALGRGRCRSDVFDECAPSENFEDESGESVLLSELPECRINFEQFFDESADAIQSALEKKSSRTIYLHPPSDNARRGSFQRLSPQKDERSASPSTAKRVQRRSESDRLRDHPARRPRVRTPSGNYGFGSRNEKADDELYELYDEFTESMPPTILKVSSRSPMSKKRYSLPQVSVSFADDPSTSTIIFEDRIIEEDEEGCQHENAKERDKSVSLKPSEHAPNPELRKSVERPRSPNLSQFREELNDEERRKFEQLQLRRQSTMQVMRHYSFVQSVSGRRASTTLLPLTPAQIHLVRSLWRQVYVTKGPTVIGSTLFHRLFFKSLKTKELFRNCPLPPQFPNHDSFFKAHCKATAELIDQIVENLDNLEAVNEELLRTGAVHAQISGGQFSGKLWNLVAETFIDCTLEWGDKRCRSETVRKAWALIVAFLSEKLKEGHAQERRHQSQLREALFK